MSVRPSVRHTRVEFPRNTPNSNKIASGIRKYAIWKTIQRQVRGQFARERICCRNSVRLVFLFQGNHFLIIFISFLSCQQISGFPLTICAMDVSTRPFTPRCTTTRPRPTPSRHRHGLGTLRHASAITILPCPRPRQELKRVADAAQAGIHSVNSRRDYTIGPATHVLYPASGAADDWVKVAADIKYS